MKGVKMVFIGGRLRVRRLAQQAVPPFLLLLLAGCTFDPFGTKEEVRTVRTNTSEDMNILRGDVLRLKEDVNNLAASVDRLSSSQERELSSLRSSVAALERQVNQTSPAVLSEVERKLAELDAKRVADKNQLVEKINAVVDQVNALARRGSTAPSGSSSTKTVSQKGFYYTVEERDTLWGIANKFRNEYGVTIEAIRQANDMGASDNRIVPGQKLFIPVKE